MKYLSLIIGFSMFVHVIGCRSAENKEEGVRGIAECKRQPKYLPFTGFMPGKAFGFSVAESGVTGLSLIQYPQNGAPFKRFSFPSWDDAGHLGAVVTDDEGNNFVIPRPFINTLQNDPKSQNIVYKIDTQTGEMRPFVNLPSVRPVSVSNPYGLLGLYFDCESKLLYASSVLGSDRDYVGGSLHAISQEGEVISTFTNIDPMGIGIAYLNGKKNIFYGDARDGNVYRIELNEDGEFDGQPIFVLTLKLLGERGDDKARKIRFSDRGEILISGISFNFNLANSPDKIGNIYTFRYGKDEKWLFVGAKKGQM